MSNTSIFEELSAYQDYLSLHEICLLVMSRCNEDRHHACLVIPPSILAHITATFIYVQTKQRKPLRVSLQVAYTLTADTREKKETRANPDDVDPLTTIIAQ